MLLTGFSVPMLNTLITRKARNNDSPIFHIFIFLSVSEKKINDIKKEYRVIVGQRYFSDPTFNEKKNIYI